MILARITLEHKVWSDRNFGDQPAWATLLGMGEEYGEACDAMADREGHLDAVGDFSIFLLHYIRIKGWDVAKMWAASHEVEPATGRPWPVLLGRLMHHELKTHQQIRGGASEHDKTGQFCAVQLLAYLRHHCKQMGVDYLGVVESTWAHVKLRDWTNREIIEAGPSGGMEHS